MSRRPTHLLIDFFGTIVEFAQPPALREHAYARTHELASSLGSTLCYDDFLASWRRALGELDRQTADDLREFTIEDVARAVLVRCLASPPERDAVVRLARSYVDEWGVGLSHRAETAEFIESLAARYRLALVSNTHDDDLVPSYLQKMGIAHCFSAVVLSTVVGRRKPHPAMFAAALGELGIEAGEALFIGDTYAADYLGPRAVGIRAVLIDPDHRQPVRAEERLGSLSDFIDELGSRPPSPG